MSEHKGPESHNLTRLPETDRITVGFRFGSSGSVRVDRFAHQDRARGSAYRDKVTGLAFANTVKGSRWWNRGKGWTCRNTVKCSVRADQ
jgi:hypothetical protein